MLRSVQASKQSLSHLVTWRADPWPMLVGCRKPAENRRARPIPRLIKWFRRAGLAHRAGTGRPGRLSACLAHANATPAIRRTGLRHAPHPCPARESGLAAAACPGLRPAPAALDRMVPRRRHLRSRRSAAAGRVLQPHERLVAHARPSLFGGTHRRGAGLAHALGPARGQRSGRARPGDQQGPAIRRAGEPRHRHAAHRPGRRARRMSPPPRSATSPVSPSS